MAIKARLRQITRMLSDLGLAPRDWDVAEGKHIRLTIRSRGQQRLYVLASTPSDGRAAANERAGVRRLLREMASCSSSTSATARSGSSSLAA